MADSLPSLHALHCFDVAARAGSFTAAARELHLTHGAISRQVRRLETELEVTLFERNGRRATLTADGVALLRATTRGFGALGEGLTELRRRRGGPLVVSCEPTLTLHWLMPRLAAFRALHPDHVLHLESSGGPVDFERSGVDVAVRRADFALAADVVAEPLMDEWLGPVCSPSYARSMRAARPRVTFLHTRTRPDAFRDFFRAAGRALVPAANHHFDHFAWSLQAAVAGLGVAIGPYPLVAEAISQRRLVAPLGYVRGEIGYVLLTRGAFERDPRAAALRAWLQTEAARMRPPVAERTRRSTTASRARA